MLLIRLEVDTLCTSIITFMWTVTGIIDNQIHNQQQRYVEVEFCGSLVVLFVLLQSFTYKGTWLEESQTTSLYIYPE